MGNEKTYCLKDFGYDLVTGSINGAIAPILVGLGGAAGTGLAKLFGTKATESVSKEGVEQTIKVAGKEFVGETGESIVKAVAKEVFDEGTESTAKTTVGKILACGTAMAASTVISASTDDSASVETESVITPEGEFEHETQDVSIDNSVKNADLTSVKGNTDEVSYRGMFAEFCDATGYTSKELMEILNQDKEQFRNFVSILCRYTVQGDFAKVEEFFDLKSIRNNVLYEKNVPVAFNSKNLEEYINVAFDGYYQMIDRLEFLLGSKKEACNAFSMIAENITSKEMLDNLLEKLSNDIDADDINDIVFLCRCLDSSPSEINFRDRKIILDAMEKNKKLLNSEGIFSQDEINYINSFKKVLIEYTDSTLSPTMVSFDSAKKMFQGFFANNNPRLDNLLSATDFSQFGKEGLPLDYPRATFISDLTEIMKGLSETEQTEILKKLGISLTNTNGDTGYDGIIDLSKLSQEGIEGDVLSLATKFIRENSIITGNSELDEALNSLIQGMPEFINIIGKQQQETQEFPVDIHILTSLKEAMCNQNYKKLSDQDKFCLKFATILQDIASQDGVLDNDYTDLSAIYARKILDKDTYSFPKEVKDRIFEIIKNQDWEQSTYHNKTATLFRKASDIDIAKTMKSKTLNANNLTEIENILDDINSSGQLVFTSKIIKKNLVPKVQHNGKEYSVIDFANMDKNFDLAKYGFAPGTTYENARLYVHMANEENFETVLQLADVSNSGFLCASYISPSNCSNTYGSHKFGLSLEVDNTNIAKATQENQYSFFRKGFGDFVDMITSEKAEFKKYRSVIPESIKQSLKLTDDEYAQLYIQLQKYKYSSQLNNI